MYKKLKYLVAMLRLGIALINSGVRGAVDLGGIIIMGVAFIITGLAIRFAPGMITSFATAWTAANDSAAMFPGLTDVVGFGPVGIILGFIIAVAFIGFLGIKRMFSGGK